MKKLLTTIGISVGVILVVSVLAINTVMLYAYTHNQSLGAYLPALQFLDLRTGLPKSVLFQAENMQVVAQPYLEALAEGDITYPTTHTPFAKFGKATNVNNSTVDLCTVGTTISFPTSAEQMVVAGGANDTVAGTGVQKVYIEGLNSSLATISEVVSTTGATNATTTNSYYRINYFMARQVGTGGSASANITLKGAGSGITFDQIDLGLTRSRCLRFTVPAGKSLYVKNVFVGCGLGGTSPKAQWNIFTTRSTWDNNNNATTSFFLPYSEIGVQNSSIDKPLEMPTKLGGGSDLKVSVIGDVSNGYICNAALRGWIE